jgi:predicted AAA+ superfamily ATPase
MRRAFTQANPWWGAAAAGSNPVAWIAGHRLLQDRARFDIGYRTRVFDDLTNERISDKLVLLTGPRRVGKSVALLDLAAVLCARGDVDPRQLVHLPCDGMQDRDLRRAFTLGRELTRSVDQHGPRPRVWLLDEITAIRGWTSVVKASRDNTPAGGEMMVLSGSHWRRDEDVEGNLLAGRAGSGEARRVRHLHPMPFRAFLSITRPGLDRPGPFHPADLQAPSVRRVLEATRFHVDEYDLAWQDFLTCGGFPRAVAEYSANGKVSTAYLRDLAAWLRADVDPDAPPDSLPILLSALTKRATSPLNIRATASELGYTKDTLPLRLNRLVAGFAAVWCPQRDASGRAIAGAQPKLYLTDSILAWLPSRLRAGLAEPAMTTLTEAALGVCLGRAIDALDEGRWVVGDTIGYGRTGSLGEVDLAPVPVPSSAGPRETIALEAKWVDAGWRSEAKTIENKYNAGIIATKSILDLDHPTWAVPAPVAALLLE